MKMIDTKTLIREIDTKKKSKFIIEFNGIINMKRKIKSIEIYEDEDNINIVDREDTEEKIKLLKHQIMKIEKRKNEYILKFDTLQNIEIKEQIWKRSVQ